MKKDEDEWRQDEEVVDKRKSINSVWGVRNDVLLSGLRDVQCSCSKKFMWDTGR